LAAEHPPVALVLECTLSNMDAMAHRYLLPGFLCRNRFDSDEVVERLTCPILIVHGRRDHTIPVSHGRRLHAVAPQSRYVELSCGHNDFRSDWDAIWSLLRDGGLLPEPAETRILPRSN
jgi:pimeloyl-ACP methyl ester carboxylesterase